MFKVTQKEWVALFKNRKYFICFVIVLALTLSSLKLCSVFLLYNETRSVGIQLNDSLLNLLNPKDVSKPLFLINWIGIFLGMATALRLPKKALALMISVICFVVLRSTSLMLFPLLPPEGIIPLRDTFLECSFYDDQVLVKDLFFSGHTASLVILFLYADIKWIKITIGVITCVVATLLMVQHVHYTIDIIAAPFFAYAAYRIGIFGSHTICTFYNKEKQPRNLNWVNN